MMELDGVSSTESEKPCRVKEVDQVFSVDEMFHLLAWKLEGRDKVDQFCRPAVTAYERYRSPTRDPRYVRIADPDDTKERVAQRGGDEGRSPLRAPPSSPPRPVLNKTRASSPKFSRASSPVTSRATGSSGRSSPAACSRQGRGGREPQARNLQNPWNFNRGGWNNPQGGWHAHPWQNGKGEQGKGKGKGEKGK